MKLTRAYRKVINSPKNKRKRILKAIALAIVKNKKPPYNYYVKFSVDGLGVYASLSPVMGLNECMIFPIIDNDTNDFDGSMELYCARGIDVCEEGLIYCIGDWLNSVLVNKSNWSYQFFKDARKVYKKRYKSIVIL